MSWGRSLSNQSSPKPCLRSFPEQCPKHGVLDPPVCPVCRLLICTTGHLMSKASSNTTDHFTSNGPPCQSVSHTPPLVTRTPPPCQPCASFCSSTPPANGANVGGHQSPHDSQKPVSVPPAQCCHLAALTQIRPPALQRSDFRGREQSLK